MTEFWLILQIISLLINEKYKYFSLYLAKIWKTHEN